MKYLRKITGIILIIGGLAAFCYPYAAEVLFDYQTSEYVREFNEKYGIGSDVETAEAQNTITEVDSTGITAGGNMGNSADMSKSEDDELYSLCAAYNKRIYEEKQSGLVDAWSYEQAAIEVDADEFGYIEIPAMDLVMPLYLGASEENMAKGATVLGQTSIPIGGENTNAVIAAHRGYRGSPYFREIEKLTIGDEVYITNQWETLTYTVTQIDIISPNNKEAIKIQEGKDMVTLITCHPYRSHGKYRYVVYCERSDSGSMADEEGSELGGSGSDSATLTASDGTVYVLSEGDISREKMLRRVCLVVLLVVFGWIVIRKRRRAK